MNWRIAGRGTIDTVVVVIIVVIVVVAAEIVGNAIISTIGTQTSCWFWSSRSRSHSRRRRRSCVVNERHTRFNSLQYSPCHRTSATITTVGYRSRNQGTWRMLLLLLLLLRRHLLAAWGWTNANMMTRSSTNTFLDATTIAMIVMCITVIYNNILRVIAARES